ncbi:MAG: MFS transporter [Calditrichaeota bacterium]|nr:MFS transporter [Calditrichota bacterium]
MDSVKRNLRLSLIDGAFAHIYANLTGGIFLPAFALVLGANSFKIGLLAAIPFLATIAQLYGSRLVEKSSSRKKPAVIYSLVSRLLWLPAIILIFLYARKDPADLLLYFILIFVFVHIFASISGVSWLSWMSSLVPVEIRGRFFGLRNSVLGVVTIVVTITGGLFLDYYKIKSVNPLTDAFIILFIIALFSSLLSSFFLNRKSEPQEHIPTAQPYRELFRQAWSNINFRHMLRFATIWSFAVNFATPFFVVYMLNELHFSYTLISIVTITAALADMAGMGFWGHLADQHGNRPIMMICAAFGSVMPFLWIFTYTDQISQFVWIPLLHLLGGFFFSGYTLSSVNMVFGIAPRNNNSAYFAMWNSANGISTALGAIAGGLFYDHGKVILDLLSEDLEWSFKFVFFVSAAIRVMSLLLVRSIDEPSTPVIKMVRILRNMRTWTTTLGFHPLLQFFIPAQNSEKSSPYWPIWSFRNLKKHPR